MHLKGEKIAFIGYVTHTGTQVQAHFNSHFPDLLENTWRLLPKYFDKWLHLPVLHQQYHGTEGMHVEMHYVMFSTLALWYMCHLVFNCCHEADVAHCLSQVVITVVLISLAQSHCRIVWCLSKLLGIVVAVIFLQAECPSLQRIATCLLNCAVCACL